jgi:PAS domain S-box-containing protein
MQYVQSGGPAASRWPTNASLIPWAIVIAFTGVLSAALLQGVRGAHAVAAAGSIIGPLIAVRWCWPRLGDGKAWRWCALMFAGAAAADVIAQSWWFYLEFKYDQPPFPSLADVAYLAEYPFLMLGILLLPPRRASLLRSGRLLLDSVIPILAISAVSWYFVVGPTLLNAAQPPLEKVLGAAYPVLDLALMFLLLLVSSQVGGVSIGRVVAPLFAGLVVIAATDTIFAYQTVTDTYQEASLLDVGWPLAYLLIALGCRGLRASAAATTSSNAGEIEAPSPAWRSFLPHCAVVLLIALTIYVHDHRGDAHLDSGVEAAMYAAVGLILLRQLLTMREKAALYARLHGAHASLGAAHATLAQSEQRLRQSEERFRVACETATDVIYELDLITGRLHWSPAIDNLLGYGPGEFPRTLEAWERTIHPLDRAYVDPALQRHIEKGEPFNLEYRVMRKDGTWLHWTDRGATIRDASGRPLRMVGAITDMTASKRIEATLRMQKALLESQSETSIDGIMVFSPRGELMSCNRRLSEMWDLPPGLCEGKQGGEVLAAMSERAGDRAAFRARIATLGDDRYASAREEVPLAAGNTLDCYSAPLYGADGTHYGRVWYFRDISAQKRSAALERERAAMRESISSMEQVLGVVGHELRTPLAGVRALCELLLTDFSGHIDETRRCLHDMHDEVVRMGDTVTNLLEAARINSGRARWNWGQISLSDVVRDVEETLRPLTNEDGADVTTSYHVAPAGASMRGDADAVRRLILNLVNNARRHTRSGTIRVDVAIAEGGEWMDVRIADTGCGMAPEIVAKLGEPFTLNVGVVSPRQAGGTGLGLAICKGIVASHGGALTVESVENVGTTVTARLRADLTEPVGARETTQIAA